MAEETAKSRILLALKESGVTQSRLAEELGLDRASVSEMLNKAGEPPSKYIKATARLTYFYVEWLTTGNGPKHPVSIIYHPEIQEANAEYLSGKSIRPVTVVVNQQGKELMTYVPVRAQAGYLKGYGDPHYIEKLPAFSLPILKDGAYRMFEVDGDSMLQQGGGGLHDGDIVISQYIEDFFTLKDRRVYVVISTDGVCVKRCINRLKDKENPILICQSDNKNGQHPDIIVRPHEIIEVWELKAFISRQLGFATDLWDMLSNVEKQVALMNEKIKRIEEERAGGSF